MSMMVVAVSNTGNPNPVMGDAAVAVIA